MENKVIIFWRDARGILNQVPPGVVVAAGMNAQAVKDLGIKNKVFVLTLSEDEEDVLIERIKPEAKKRARKKPTPNVE